MSDSNKKRSLPSDSLDSKQIKKKEDLLQENYVLDNINKDIFEYAFVQDKQKEIEESTPYKWGYLKDIFNPDLLNSIRKEIESNIRFTEKETDIYRVNQSGDLANLNKLSDEQIIEKLPNLYILQNIIYSKFWRDYICKILKCGPLSGVKTDLSVNTYDKGCHLLIHDDVISSRRVSFILYLPEQSLDWKISFGGNLKLYDSFVKNIPMSDADKSFIPQFNSMAFFEVQPGYSFHEVEEVKVDKHRISIQGWYHIPQRGEQGFVEGEEEAWMKQNNSTLKQLKMGGDAANLQNFEFPSYTNKDDVEKNISSSEFTKNELKELATYINPKYLPENFEQLQSQYEKDGEKLIIKNFLVENVAKFLKKDIRNYEINVDAPKSYSEIEHPWKCAWPTSKWRFLYIDGKPEFKITKGKSIKELTSLEKSLKTDWNVLLKDYEKSLEEEDGDDDKDDAYITDDEFENESNILSVLKLSQFLNGETFKKYLAKLTSLNFQKEKILVRRFRPGYDYTLATTGTDSLDFNLGLTPTSDWQFKMGGYQIYMKNDEADDEDDDAVYKRSTSNSNQEEEEDDNDGVLLNEVPEFNKLIIIKRSKMDLEFVKYLSASCHGSRWDVQGTFDI
ncbi:hypothetical protein ACO0SA_000168 [Hanseniaspora valbyensis]